MAFQIITKTCPYCKTVFQGPAYKHADFCSLPCRFWSKVKVLGIDDCWEWQGASDGRGYGHFSFKHRADKAPRIAWFLFSGTYPGKLDVLHKCDNPPCVNPNHLFLGTAKDNAIDMVKKGRCKSKGLPGEQSGNAKLTTNQVILIKRLLALGYGTTLIGKQFNVYPSTIHFIKQGETWRHIV